MSLYKKVFDTSTGVVTSVTIDRVTRSGQTKIVRLGSQTTNSEYSSDPGAYEAKRGEQIVKVKVTGNASADAPVDLWLMDGTQLISGQGVEDADEFNGPFSKVQVGDTATSAGFCLVYIKRGD
jgi:hypothetical protein